MTQSILVVGGSSGVGLACVGLLKQNSNFLVRSWGSDELDLNFPERIFSRDLAHYDFVINCAAHSHGTYQGFLTNSWQNQLSQIMVNYASNLFLFKHYANSRTSGKYVWCSTDLSQGVTPYKSVYLSTKVASQYAFDLIQKEATHVDILEVRFGAVKTNFRYRNFQGSLSRQQVDDTYKDTVVLDVQYVAKNIVAAMQTNQNKVLIT